MKRQITTTMLVVAFGLVPTSSAAAGEPLFVGPQTIPIGLTGKGIQTFTLANGKSVQCEDARGSGTAGITTLKSISMLVSFTQCEAFGNKATVSTGNILFDANGAMGIAAPDELVITVPAAKCSIRVPSGGGNASLGTVKYSNEGNHILGDATVTGINYEVASAEGHSSCGTNKEVGTASYSGEAISALPGYTLKYETIAGEPLFVGPQTIPIGLTGKGSQTLSLANGKSIICEGLAGSGAVGATTLKSISMLVKFSECEAFADAATVSTGNILFDANGAVGIAAPDELVITVPVAKCSVRIPPGGGNVSLGTIKYSNEGNGIFGSAEVTGIEYEVNSASASSSCGTSKLLVKGASYKGGASSALAGYTIKWES
jgi:hypothetical protein